MKRDLVTLASHLGYIEELIERYKNDPNSVDTSWHEVLRNGAMDLPVEAFVRPSTGRGDDSSGFVYATSSNRSSGNIAAEPLRVAGGFSLIHGFRTNGHLVAKIDPLDMLHNDLPSELTLDAHGLSPKDIVKIPEYWGRSEMTAGEVHDYLTSIYCRSIGAEISHISSPERNRWVTQAVESRFSPNLLPDKEDRIAAFHQVLESEALERFFHVKYPGTKRFSLEGSETLAPILDRVLVEAAKEGVIETVIGMAHRGRLNVLCQTVGRSPQEMFADFEDVEPETAMGGGDVKYHLGYSSDRVDRFGREMHVSLTFNPSHLEAVDPVVCGRVRAKQRRHKDWEHKKVLGVLVHGDAAFAGQGLVAETLNLSNLHGYRTGGTVHIIVNNQIGFTATPQEARSTTYCTDVAKMIQCPVFHVNGEDLDAVLAVVDVAMEYRAKFQSDVVIDMLCYRKFGHNEMDEPSFTNPVMYERIKKKRSLVEVYADKLVSEGVIPQGEIARLRGQVRQRLEGDLEKARAGRKRPRNCAMKGVWSQYQGGNNEDCPEPDTGVDSSVLATIADKVSTIPAEIRAHKKIQKLFLQRKKMGAGELELDWGMAETLAYGSLLWEGTNVRLTGQDSVRGTFSHRHAMVVDIVSGEEHMPLGNLHADQGACRVYDSPLSEAGVLGFEFGYSLDYPDALVLWEAQFGDFVNGAQVILDQFLVASEDKWNRLSGLVLLLPHGYEGQGPEHSSARLERFLQACGEDNIQVCQPTTPAQMFHMLRRQVNRVWRKPLVVMTPKSLLRHPQAKSDISELTRGKFEPVLVTDAESLSTAESVVVCTGKIYYELLAKKKALGVNTPIVRIERLYPWPKAELVQALCRTPLHTQIVWAQEEPENMGAGQYVVPKLVDVTGSRALRVVARAESASPATGSHNAHAMEQDQVVAAAFGL